MFHCGSHRGELDAVGIWEFAWYRPPPAVQLPCLPTSPPIVTITSIQAQQPALTCLSSSCFWSITHAVDIANLFRCIPRGHVYCITTEKSTLVEVREFLRCLCSLRAGDAKHTLRSQSALLLRVYFYTGSGGFCVMNGNERDEFLICASMFIHINRILIPHVL